MKYSPPPARTKRWTLLSMPLVFALSACTTVVQVTPTADRCFTRMTANSGLTEDTPHASLPSSPTVGAWIDYGNRESGQTDKANADKRAITAIGKTCDEMRVEAQEKAKKEPWWKIW